MTTTMRREITGRHVLFGLIAFFVFIIGVNVVMAWFATKTFPGTVVDSPYRANQAYNAEAAAARAQAARGWQVDVNVVRSNERGADIKLVARDSAGAALRGMTATIQLQRRTDRHADFSVPLGEREPGIYVGNLAAIESGQWEMKIAIDGKDGVQFRSQNRVILP